MSFVVLSALVALLDALVVLVEAESEDSLVDASDSDDSLAAADELEIAVERQQRLFGRKTAGDAIEQVVGELDAVKEVLDAIDLRSKELTSSEGWIHESFQIKYQFLLQIGNNC